MLVVVSIDPYIQSVKLILGVEVSRGASWQPTLGNFRSPSICVFPRIHDVCVENAGQPDVRLDRSILLEVGLLVQQNRWRWV